MFLFLFIIFCHIISEYFVVNIIPVIMSLLKCSFNTASPFLYLHIGWGLSGLTTHFMSCTHSLRPTQVEIGSLEYLYLNYFGKKQIGHCVVLYWLNESTKDRSCDTEVCSDAILQRDHKKNNYCLKTRIMQNVIAINKPIYV